MNKQDSGTYCVCSARVNEIAEKVPVGNTYIHQCELVNIPCRWVNDMGIEDEDGDNFQVFYDGKWLEAQSIDFDFPNIQQLTVNYQTLMQEYSNKVNEVISGKQTASLICPDYASEVVIPVIKLLAKALPESNIIIPNRENYGLSGGYYRVYAENKLIGGFSHPVGNEAKLLFSPAFHRCFSTGKHEITDIQHLIDLIKSNI